MKENPPHNSSRSTVGLSRLLADERRFSHCNGTKVEQNIVLSWIYLWQRLDALSSHLDDGLGGAGG